MTFSRLNRVMAKGKKSGDVMIE